MRHYESFLSLTWKIFNIIGGYVWSDIWGQRISEQSFRSKGWPLYTMAIHAAIGGCGRLTETPTRTRIRLAVY